MHPVPFPAIDLTLLDAVLADPIALLLDLRTPAAFSRARLPNAINLSVPSTLLRRPLFSLQRLAAMLPPAPRARFAAYPTASRILVYDADPGPTPNAIALLTKLANDGFRGELAWLRGGFQAVARERPQLLDSSPLPTRTDHATDSNHAIQDGPILRTHSLPPHAFTLSSTTAAHSPASASTCPATNPFYDTIRQNFELANGITERIPLRLPPRVRRRVSDLPFAWLRDIAARAERTFAPASRHLSFGRTTGVSCRHLSKPVSPVSVKQGADVLATQFHAIELAEQRRLMNIMQHHAKQTDSPLDQVAPGCAFPFSILAGVEKGTKNRYRHIWPFEHARVKLHRRPGDDDYVNASYVQPLCTDRRYIATQGPLEATFDDFWQLCWEQNVYVIIMLTKEIENSLVKCGSYWADIGPGMPSSVRTFGPFKITLISKVGLPGNIDFSSLDDVTLTALKSASTDGTPFSWNPNGDSGRHDASGRQHITTIKRTFELVHSGYPNARARQIAHLQYLEWSDMNVPDDPRGVLRLVREVERAIEETGGHEDVGESVSGVGESDETKIDPQSGFSVHALTGPRPVLLHCSAGVGRTGGFIIVDAVLDAIRREMKEEARLEKQDKGGGLQFADEWVSDYVSLKLQSVVPDVTLPAADCKQPRPLHLARAGSPQRLSVLRDPVWEVVQDMREQRMSLCQTLRQYVFVHAAIVEGALMIVDEARGVEVDALDETDGESSEIDEDEEDEEEDEADAEENEKRREGEREGEEVWMTARVGLEDENAGDYFMMHAGIGASPATSPRSLMRRVCSQPLVSAHQRVNTFGPNQGGGNKGATTHLGPLQPTTGKRGASPTELPEKTKLLRLGVGVASVGLANVS